MLILKTVTFRGHFTVYGSAVHGEMVHGDFGLNAPILRVLIAFSPCIKSWYTVK